MVLDYMKGDLPNFRYGQAKINKDAITKFKSMDKVLENIYGKVTGSEDLSVKCST
jgi:hypothetical protein